MQHTVKLVGSKELNDDQVSFLLRCCDDASTDSWATVSLSLAADEAEAALKGHQARMAANHENKTGFRTGKHPILAVVADSTISL